jgi:endogenous inhibitor of DNA gyrase (YacG/DUF329 family)
MKVLCIGEVLIDMICTDKGSSLSKGQNFIKKAGGAPANVAAAAVEETQCPACGKTITVPEPEKERDLTCIHCGKPLHWRASN